VTERPRPHPTPEASPSSWNAEAIAGALGVAPEPAADVAFGQGLRFRLGEVQPVDLELFPAQGVVRLTGGDLQLSLFRQHAGPALAPEGLVFALPSQPEGRFLSVSPAGEVTLDQCVSFAAFAPGTKFKVVTGYRGGNGVNLAMERGEVAARNNTWSSWKVTKPDWLKNKDIIILVQAGPTAKDLPGVPTLADLGLPRELYNVCNIKNGIVLVTGPTGSGKTNTLYSAISLLNKPNTNIMTAEDPVEFQLQGINQVQMKEQIGLNFAAALRSFLRQDPNIILVGEIRDFETAEIAIKAALTGHLVLSTLHTNGAPETISRLMNMGVEPFLVATSVHLIVAQRLVRRICSKCAEPTEVPQPALIQAGFTKEEAQRAKIMKGKGCDHCNQTGYKGRTGLYEVMEIDESLRELILVGASSLELKKKAIENGMITLRRSGIRKMLDGVTTMDEVLRETIL